MKHKREKLVTFLLVLSDIAAISGAVFLAYFLRDKWLFGRFLDFAQPFDVYVKAAPFATIVFLLLFRYFGLYTLKMRVVKAEEMFAVLKAVSFGVLLLMAGSYLVKYDYSRIVVFLFFLFCLVFVSVGRYFVRWLQFKFILFKKRTTRIIIVGSGELAKKISSKLGRYKDWGYELVGFFHFDHKFEVKNQFESFYRIVSKESATEVYIADSSLNFKDILCLISQCPHKVCFKVASDSFRLLPGFASMNFIDDIPELDIGRQNPDFLYRFGKRFFDFIFSVAFLVLSLPFWLLIAVLIKVDSKGPIIFKHKRIGKKGKIFKIYKFRTMKTDVDPYEYAPDANADGRVTRIGKFLRKTSLDELPQLLNIFKGEMSFVGPRPEMPFIVERYEDWQKKRLLVNPGLTGLWQILGRKDLPLHENLEYDFYYINNQCFSMDMIIILKTIPALLWGRGAY